MQFTYVAIFTVLATIAAAVPNHHLRPMVTEPAAHSRSNGLGLGLDISVHL
ncbi:hypothetical protein GGI05_003905 [Coemansia sp. RSA 2603]|nr:hypothetical protein GGI05_003905 [Coemansia sp. RSA 2603]